MNKISVEEALVFAEENFPKAPERLAAHLKIEIKYSLLNCDGWCLQHGNRAIIRINNREDIPKTRQKFTLAHELGHIILGIPAIVGESMQDTFIKGNNEEKLVNDFASKFLLPESVIKSEFNKLPITSTRLKKVARRARVSDLVVARRIAFFAKELGLKEASVLFFKDNKLNYQMSETLKVEKIFANEILIKCIAANHKTIRVAYEKDDVIVASAIENPNSNTKIIFLQIVNDKDGFRHLHDEKVKDLAKNIFDGDEQFRNTLNGRFGGFKKIAKTMSLENAVELFNERLNLYPDNLTKKQLKLLASELGQEFIRLKLQY